MSLSIRQKGLLLVSVPIVFELGFIALLASYLAQGQAIVEQESRARGLIAHAIEVTMSCQDAYIALGKFGFCHEMSAYTTAQKNLSNVQNELGILKDLTSGRPNELQMVKDFDNAIRRWVDIGEVVQESYVKNDMFGYLRVLPNFFAASDGVHEKARVFVSYLSNIENKQLHEHGALIKQIRNLMIWGVVISTGVTTLLSFLFFHDLTRRLQMLKANSKALKEGTTLPPPQVGDDEISYVDKAFRQMAAVLAERRQKELAIVENAADVICSIDLKGRFSQVSPASVPLWGYTPEELLGENWSTVLHPDDVAATQRAVASIRDSGNSLLLENTIIKKDSEMRDALWSVRWSEEQKTLFCVAHDITERRTAQSRLEVTDLRARSVVESMPIGVITATINGVIESVNGKAQELFKARSEQLQSLNLFRLFTPLSVQKLQDVLASQKDGITVELTATRLNGSEFPCEVRTSKYKTLEGEKYQINIVDVTARHEIERLKQELISMVSHDLRTPLTSVQGTLTLLGDGIYGEVAPGGDEEIGSAVEEIDRLIEMVSDLLDLEKIESGKMSMQLQQVPVEKVITTAIESVSEKALSKGIEIICESAGVQEGAGLTSPVVLIDADRITQVLSQLLSAAIHFSQKTVLVRTETSGGKIRISVIDNGPSVPDSVHEAIFDRFRRMEALDNERAQYSGLSLALAKSIVTAQRGNIGITECGDGQTSIWITLPSSCL